MYNMYNVNLEIAWLSSFKLVVKRIKLVTFQNQNELLYFFKIICKFFAFNGINCISKLYI